MNQTIAIDQGISVSSDMIAYLVREHNRPDQTIEK